MNVNMDFTDIRLDEFINNIIICNSIDDILDKCKTQSIKGFVFERLWDIIIKFGFCPIFSNSKFIHKIGNANNGKLKTLENLNKYITDEKVCSGNSGGCSDITLQNKQDNTFIFISSKFPKSSEDITKEKSVDYYDIQNIIAMRDKYKEIYKNYDIFLVVPDKNKVLSKVKSSKKSSQYITDYIKEEKLLDKNDLNKYFLEFKNDIIKNKEKYDKLDYNELYLTPKDKLNLRFHQELITQKTSDLIAEGHKSFLWGCKCRSGKTYMSGGIIIKEADKKDKLNVLIITPAPTETAPQFTDDLFDAFKDFDFFKIHNIEGSKSLKNLKLENDNIFVMSKQLLQKYVNDDTIMEIKNLKLDLIIFDENHFSGTTELSKYILDSYASKNTVKIYLTATYNKPLKEWNIPEECQMYWDIEDEQFCKSILNDETNITKLKEKHNEEYINKTIKHYTELGYNINDIFKSYEKMPDLYLITTMFDSQRYEIIKAKIMDSKYGFSFDVLFSLKNDKTEFNFRDEVKTILRYISGSNKEVDFKTDDKSIFTRINKICSRPPFTQIWFLPSDNINEISNCLMKLMKEDDILKHYDVLCINRKNKDLAKDVKDEINKQEIISREKGKKGLILLAGNMITLGITINSCDVVILMNNTLSSDKVLQQMYRCMTEGNNKKMGFVVDLNISRVLNTCINYTIYKNSNSVEDKVKYLIENHLINIDTDMMKNKNLDSDKIVKKLMDIWKDDPINSFKSLLRNLDNDYVEFDNQTQKLINNSFTNSVKDKKIDTTIEIKDSDDELQELPTGKEKVKTNSDDNELTNDDVDTKNEKENKISFTKDVLPYIIPLTCILTIENNNKDFVKMLNDIKENKELLEVFDEQCLIWWNKKGLVNFIQEIINKYFDKNSNTYNISIQFKMSIQSLIDRPKELLELINECLKPKTVEKKTFGEVFTPMYLINEMLDKLPKEVWKNKNLKWLDPCVGMGNFMVAIYLRLMDGLKDIIIDDKERKKHILENMLFMCELNKKNVFVCKQIFNINNEYKLKIHEGDFLEFEQKKVFNINNFDIIVGNPPYQDDTGNKGNKLWTKFVEIILDKKQFLNNNGYLLFVHPSLWRQIDHKIQKIMTNKQIIYLEIHNEKDGFKTFSANTRYDWYLLQNKEYEYDTIIKDENNKIVKVNINKMKFIPNYNFNIISKLTSSDIKVEILHSESIYEPRKKWMSGNKDNTFKFPCIYSINKSNTPSFKWSNINDKGHFGIPKVIWGGGATGFIFDKTGEYGMTQWASAIVDNVKILPIIKEALESDNFNKIIKAISVSKQEINYKILREFNKDFYKIINNNNLFKELTEEKIINNDLKEIKIIEDNSKSEIKIKTKVKKNNI
jgi:hypothetical protein